jgi:hypothetical protein
METALKKYFWQSKKFWKSMVMAAVSGLIFYVVNLALEKIFAQSKTRFLQFVSFGLSMLINNAVDFILQRSVAFGITGNTNRNKEVCEFALFAILRTGLNLGCIYFLVTHAKIGAWEALIFVSISMAFLGFFVINKIFKS